MGSGASHKKGDVFQRGSYFCSYYRYIDPSSSPSPPNDVGNVVAMNFTYSQTIMILNAYARIPTRMN